jgi:uncharacterized membrane protein
MGVTSATDPAPPSRPRLNRWQCGFVVLFFVAIEAPLFFWCSTGADVAIYGEYAQRWRTGSLRTLYDPEHDERTVEYPPLAIGFARLIDLVAQRLPAQGAFYDYLPEHGEARRYAFAYRSVMALLLLLILIAVLWLLNRYFGHETRWARLERVAVFVVGVGCLAPVVFDRLDLVLGALILLAAMLAAGGRHWLLSAGVLAAGIGFKVTPVVLVPFWALATVPRAWFAELSSAAAWGRLGLGLALRCASVIALAAVACLPFYLLGGPGCLDFFHYHAERGIECESTYAAAVAVLGQLGMEVGCVVDYGAFEVKAACTPLLIRLAPWVVGVALLLAFLAYFNRLRREGRGDAVEGPLGLIGPLFVAILLFLWGNKVLSPQYFLWLLPLAPLMPFSGWARRGFLLGFAVVCILTFGVFPVADRALIGEWLPPGGPFQLSGPTLGGALILSARSLAMLALAVGLATAFFYSDADRDPVKG